MGFKDEALLFSGNIQAFGEKGHLLGKVMAAQGLSQIQADLE